MSEIESKSEKLNIDELLKSQEFRDNREAILFRLGKQQSDFADDLRQEMAIAVIEATRTYKPEKMTKHKNFWAHASLRMMARAKDYAFKYSCILKIPKNRNGAKCWVLKGYEPARVETVNIEYNDGTITPIPVYDDCLYYFDVNQTLDCTLDESEKFIMRVKLGLDTTPSGGYDYKSIAEFLGTDVTTVVRMFNRSKRKLMRFMKKENGGS